MQPFYSLQFTPDIYRDVYKTSTLPEEITDDLVAAMIGFITVADKIILCKNQRGRDVTGGHVDPGETPLQALIRECKEEGGVDIDIEHISLWGYKKRTHAKPHAHRDNPSRPYPFPLGYTLIYHCPIDEQEIETTGAEILTAASFSYEEIQDIDVYKSSNMSPILKEFYRSVMLA